MMSRGGDDPRSEVSIIETNGILHRYKLQLYIICMCNLFTDYVVHASFKKLRSDLFTEYVVYASFKKLRSDL